MLMGARHAAWLLTLLIVFAPVARAEVLEEIVALVDGDILTKSEYEREEQAMIQGIYRQFSGADLDQAVAAVRRTLLTDLIDRKILVHRASRLFDTKRMEQVFFDNFREQQQIKDDAEFAAMLAREGMTIESMKTRLVESFAPDEVVRFEVSSRVSVADHEIDDYYAGHPDEFHHEDEVKLREIVLLADTLAKKIDRRAEIDAIRARLNRDNFAEVATEVSEAGTKEAGGLLGNVHPGDLSETLEGYAFALQPGQVSEVLEMPYGFHILFAEEVRVGATKTLDEVREELRAKLEDERFAERLREFMVKARSESEWCVKEKYAASLSAQNADKVCKEM